VTHLAEARTEKLGKTTVGDLLKGENRAEQGSRVPFCSTIFLSPCSNVTRCSSSPPTKRPFTRRSTGMKCHRSD
jgi:hypothetical protein